MKMKYEKRALVVGLIINLVSSILGLSFYFITRSLSIFLDALISLILCVSTLVSIRVSNASVQEPSEKYPLGRYAIENLFVLFRSIMLICTIVFSFTSGASNIFSFLFSRQETMAEINNLALILYAVVMSGLCFLITVVYSHYNKKLNNKSSIIRIEIMASLFDGFVTVVAIASLLAFQNISFLSQISSIGDSITVMMLSILYIFKPIKELIEQMNILTDRRMHPEEEKALKKELSKLFTEITFYDIYICDSGSQYNIYITFLPKKDQKSTSLGKLSNYLYEMYGDTAQVYLHATKKPLHLL